MTKSKMTKILVACSCLAAALIVSYFSSALISAHRDIESKVHALLVELKIDLMEAEKKHGSLPVDLDSFSKSQKEIVSTLLNLSGHAENNINFSYDADARLLKITSPQSDIVHYIPYLGTDGTPQYLQEGTGLKKMNPHANQ